MFTIPNQADAGHSSQSEIDKVDIDILVAALGGQGVVSGGAVTAQGSPDQTVAVAAGVARINGALVTVASGNVNMSAADVTNPRFDLVVVNDAGTKSAVDGVAAASPIFPAIPANSVVLAAVRRAANDNAIATAEIIDKRCGVANVIVQKDDSDVDNDAHVLDFEGDDFDVTSDPAGEANISARFIGAQVSNSVAQAVPDATATALTADTESFNTDSLHSTVSNTSRITVPVTGYYLLNCNVYFAANTTGKRVVDFRLNGTTFFGTSAVDPDGSLTDPNIPITAIVLLAATDYVEVIAFQNSLGSLNVTLQRFSAARMLGA